MDSDSDKNRALAGDREGRADVKHEEIVGAAGSTAGRDHSHLSTVGSAPQRRGRNQDAGARPAGEITLNDPRFG